MFEKKTTYKCPLFTSLFLFKEERYSFFGFTTRFSLRQSISIQLKVQFNHLLWALFELGIKFNQLFRQSIRFTVQHWLLETIQFCIHNQKCSSILNPIQYLKIPPIQFMIQHYTSSHYGIVKKDLISSFHCSYIWPWIRLFSTYLKIDPEQEVLGWLQLQQLSYKCIWLVSTNYILDTD